VSGELQLTAFAQASICSARAEETARAGSMGIKQIKSKPITMKTASLEENLERKQ
jgi:hypothetical protein